MKQYLFNIAISKEKLALQKAVYKLIYVYFIRMRFTLIAVGILVGMVLFSACVPQKKLLLLQENPNVENQGNADALLRTIDLKLPVYTLKAGDVLSITVQSTTPAEFNFLSAAAAGAGDPVLSGYTVDAQGNILLPVIGEVKLGGLTVPEAREKVTESLQTFLSDPTVNLRLLTFRYTILGEVGGQGQFTTYQDNINIMEAIASAGGFNPYSNRGRIRLVRYENNQAKLYTLSLLDDNTIAMSNFYLQPNDMIVVDPLPAKFVRENVVANVGLGLGIMSTIFFLIDRFTR